MSKRPKSLNDGTSKQQRLGAALRANLARRKAQGRARAAEAAEHEAEQNEGLESSDPANQEN